MSEWVFSLLLAYKGLHGIKAFLRSTRTLLVYHYSTCCIFLQYSFITFNSKIPENTEPSWLFSRFMLEHLPTSKIRGTFLCAYINSDCFR